MRFQEEVMLDRLFARSARLDAIKADIAERLDCCDLSLADVADRQQVTPRYVQMLFEREGTTFSRFVLRQRLTRAHGMLTDPRHDGWTIAAIAFEAGFGDLSYFNRAFRRQFVVPPSSVRAAVRFLASEAAQAHDAVGVVADARTACHDGVAGGHSLAGARALLFDIALMEARQ
jgi:AraC-like DNA-binding protein